ALGEPLPLALSAEQGVTPTLLGVEAQRNDRLVLLRHGGVDAVTVLSERENTDTLGHVLAQARGAIFALGGLLEDLLGGLLGVLLLLLLDGLVDLARDVAISSPQSPPQVVQALAAIELETQLQSAGHAITERWSGA